jgi:glycosyltransferase involved in cell wall biosynthesis
VLLIAQEFPPPVTGGSIRIAKHAKYLARLGWNVFVICKDMGGRGVAAEAPGHFKVIRVKDYACLVAQAAHKAGISGGTKGLSPASLSVLSPLMPSRARLRLFAVAKAAFSYLAPDLSRWLWCGRAKRAAIDLIRAYGIEYVLSSSPPASTHLVALSLKRRLGARISWLADFRDLWSLSPTFRLGLARNRVWNRAIEKVILGRADRVCFVSDSMKDHVIRQLECGSRIRQKSIVLTNGYDEEDFKREGTRAPLDGAGATLTLRYLGSVLGPRQENAFAEGLKLYNAAHPDIRINVAFHGVFTPDFVNRYDPLGHIVSFYPPLPHRDALDLMERSDALLLLLTNDMEGRIAFTGKFFEYLRARKPILALAPAGEVSRVIEENGIGERADPDSAASILKALERLVDGISTGRYEMPSDDSYIRRFERSEIARELSNELCRMRALGASRA